MEILTKDVCVQIGGKEIVKEASIRVKRGELVGLFGPNGSGKSTLLKSIYRVLKPSAGEIFLDGTEMKKNIAPRFCEKHGCCNPVYYPEL